jgi:hypothetical protein
VPSPFHQHPPGQRIYEIASSNIRQRRWDESRARGNSASTGTPALVSGAAVARFCSTPLRAGSGTRLPAGRAPAPKKMAHLPHALSRAARTVNTLLGWPSSRMVNWARSIGPEHVGKGATGDSRWTTPWPARPAFRTLPLRIAHIPDMHTKWCKERREGRFQSALSPIPSMAGGIGDRAV